MTWQGVKASCRERTRLLRLEVVDLGVFELTELTMDDLWFLLGTGVVAGWLFYRLWTA